MPDDSVGIRRARELATSVFAPAAMTVEASQRVPPEHLDLLAAEGFYGLAGPREAGGLDVPFPVACRIIEILAGACLSTTFVWMQHHGVVRAVAAGPAALRQEMLGPLCRGERRAGVALAGLLPGPPRLRARAAGGAGGGYVLDGVSPWVTGWDYIDTLYVAARREDDTIVWALLDVAPGAGAGASPTAASLTAEPLSLVAVMASSTVQLSFTGHPVPQERVTATLPFAQWPGRDAAGLRANGSLALGLAARCCELIGPGPLDEQLGGAGPCWTRPARTPCPGPAPPPASWPPARRRRSWSARGPGRSWPARMRSGWPGRPCSCWCSAPGHRSGRR